MDTPIERLARYIRAAVKQGDSYGAIAKRAKAGNYQNVQNIALANVNKTTFFVPICNALGLDPMKVWYGGAGEPFDNATRKILTIIQDWTPEERAALVVWVEKFRPSEPTPNPRRTPRKKAVA